MGFELLGRRLERTRRLPGALAESCTELRSTRDAESRTVVPKVSTYYLVSSPVPFVDVRVERDNRLFVEPSAIKAAAALGDRYALAADRALTSFFGEVLDSVRRGDRPRGRRLLAHLHEPNETRLGMTRVGVAGHGMASGLADDLWTAMANNRACQRAALVGRIEDLAPYVDGVGPDLVSDLSTRIAFDVLVRFTTEMMGIYPALGVGASTAVENVWDVTTTRWVTERATLPVAAGKRLLLVPTNWVWHRQLLNAPSFYQVQALGRIQKSQTRPPRVRGGRPTGPTKKLLRRTHPRVRPTNISQAVDAADAGVNLTARHTVHVQERFKKICRPPSEINALI